MNGTTVLVRDVNGNTLGKVEIEAKSAILHHYLERPGVLTVVVAVEEEDRRIVEEQRREAR